MILDDLKYASAYRTLSANIATAFDWMKETNIDDLKAPQVITVDGEKVFAQIQSYESMPAEEGRFESHYNYIDIQYLQSGNEILLWTPLHTLTPAGEYDSENDVRFYKDAPCSSILLRPGQFALFFPEDGHKPKCMVEQREPIGKIVVKVAVS